MPDKPFKQFERECAKLIGGRRHWSNSGEKIDVESDRIAGQCKFLTIDTHVTLAQLSQVLADTEKAAKKVGKMGLLFLKLRAGSTVPTPTWIIATPDTWKRLFPTMDLPAL